MILNFIITVIFDTFNALFSIFPTASLSNIPYVGSLIVSTITSAVKTWNTILETIPYLQFSWNAFLYVIIPAEIILLLMKFALGSRAPINEK